VSKKSKSCNTQKTVSNTQPSTSAAASKPVKRGRPTKAEAARRKLEAELRKKIIVKILVKISKFFSLFSSSLQFSI
jgi:hypothetical protein